MTQHLPPSILVIEEDNVIKTNISNNLERKGYNVLSYSNAQDAITGVTNSPSYMYPSLSVIGKYSDSIEVEKIFDEFKKSNSNKPVLFIHITDDQEKADELKAKGIIHDYMTSPFSQIELVNNIKSTLSTQKPVLVPRVISYCDLKIDLSSYRVSKGGKEIHLGPTEFKILQLLMDNPSETMSREQIMKYIWGNSNVEERTIDVHVNRLRSALKDPQDSTSYIKTVRSVGYKLEK